jgi:hypothetical protein
VSGCITNLLFDIALPAYLHRISVAHFLLHAGGLRRGSALKNHEKSSRNQKAAWPLTTTTHDWQHPAPVKGRVAFVVSCTENFLSLINIIYLTLA